MEHVTIALSEDSTQIALHPHFMEKPHVFPQTISFLNNMHNIRSVWGNTKLYLTPTFFITIPDGLYTVDSINKLILQAQLNVSYYYLIAPSVTGDSYDIYQFNSTSDWLNFINYTVQPVSQLSVLNQDIKTGVAFLTSLFIKTELLHVHSNENATNGNESQSLITVNTLEVPVVVDIMEYEHHTFLSKMCHENKQNASITVTLLDRKGWTLTPRYPYPRVSFRY